MHFCSSTATFMSQIEIYTGTNGEIGLEVTFEQDTVWLNQYQLSELFQTDRTSVQKHLKNIYATAELNETATCAKIAQVQQEGKRTVKREVLYYNLDAIISVGYRVNSKKGTQFRQWATQRLKDYLTKGHALNQQRLQQLQQVVNIIQQSGEKQSVNLTEAKGLLEIITHYTQSFVLLNQYDSNSLHGEGLVENITYEIQYDEALVAISELKRQLIAKKEASDLFGNQKDGSFEGILQSVVQTFGSVYLYPSIEEQAAHLLYLLLKSSVLRWQQTHRRVFICVVFRKEPASLQNQWRSEN